MKKKIVWVVLLWIALLGSAGCAQKGGEAKTGEVASSIYAEEEAFGQARWQGSEESKASEETQKNTGEETKEGSQEDTQEGSQEDTQKSTGAETQAGTGKETRENTQADTDARQQDQHNTAETSQPQQMTLLMVGDMLMHTPVTNSGRLEDESYNYDHLFTHVKEEISGADVAIVNQEVILGGTELGLSGYPRFNAAYELGDSLVNAGFDVVLHATNHALDKGEQGVRNCLAFWEQEHPKIFVAGIHESSEARQSDMVIVEEQGIKVAILNYTYSTNGIPKPENAPYLVDMLDKELIKKDVALARESADFVIVCPHWGTEYRHESDKSQKNWVKFLADLEVDLVLGTHPHVIEPVEWVESENGHKMLVYYSIGNFVNATSGKGDGVADRMLGAMAKVVLQRTQDQSVTIAEYDAIPIVSHVKSGIQQITVYPLSEYTEELAQENEIIRQDPNFSLDYLKRVWEQVCMVPGDGA